MCLAASLGSKGRAKDLLADLRLTELLTLPRG